jgi:hypothetical protein
VSDRGRRLAVFLPVLVTVLLAAVIGALIVVQNQRQSDQVTAADGVAEAFLSDVGTFRGEVARAMRGARTADPEALRRALKKALADPPQLGDASPYGTEQSASYVAAQDTEQTFLQPYRRLDRELRKADVSLTFIEAARAALELRATDFVGSGPLDDSGPVRSRLIPAFVAARDRLAMVQVPDGQGRLAATVRDAVQYVIDQATTLADSIEANRSFSFTYSQQFKAAADAVNDYATIVHGDVTEAINTAIATS